MVLTGCNKGFREITFKAKAIVLAKFAIDEFFMANPTIKARLKSLDESDAAAARTIFLSWLTNCGAINLPANSNNSRCVCTWCDECGRSNSCERGCHVACSTVIDIDLCLSLRIRPDHGSGYLINVLNAGWSELFKAQLILCGTVGTHVFINSMRTYE
ncbi:hypothetical protein T492DRAFT_832318 [Pavlovales sp. CCMP2436]|nr:hypothetical protein T492DRAFT_832318 [Pavlovales sp. CCMP2436]